MSWIPGASLAWRIFSSLVSIARDVRRPSELHLEKVASTWEVESKRYAFEVVCANRGNVSIKLDLLHVRKPVGAALRDDPPIIMYAIGDDIVYKREANLGPAVKVLGLGHELAPQETASVEFILVSPQDWLGGSFEADLSYTVNGAISSTRVLKIKKHLSPSP